MHKTHKVEVLSFLVHTKKNSTKNECGGRCMKGGPKVTRNFWQ